MKKLLLVCLLLVGFPGLGQAQYKTGGSCLSALTINQTTDWVLLTPSGADSFFSAFIVQISHTTAAHCVQIMETNALPSSDLEEGGVRLCRKSGEPDPPQYKYLLSEGWQGPLYVRAEHTGVKLIRCQR